MALSPVPAAQRDAGFVSWFSCTLVSDKKSFPEVWECSESQFSVNFGC